MRADCTHSSYIVEAFKACNRVCPRCQKRYTDKSAGMEWVDVVPCKECLSKRANNKRRALKGKRRLTYAEHAEIVPVEF